MSYEAVARPLGVAFLALAAVCPFLGWKRTDASQFAKNVRVPAVVAVVVFVALLVEFFTNLLPVYGETLARGGTAAEDLASMGPSWYYNGLAVVALLVASLLAANSAYLIVRGVRGRMRSKGEGVLVALGRLFAKSPAQAGGYLTHLGMGIVLVGLVGSSMYVTERNLIFTEPGQTESVGAYELTYVGDEIPDDLAGDYRLSEQYRSLNAYYDASNNLYLFASFDISKEDVDLGRSDLYNQRTASSLWNQVRYNSDTRSTPLEDFFVVYQGRETSVDALYVNARVNPLISFVWAGFFVVALGIVCATWPKRGSAALAAAEARPARPEGDAR